MKVTVSIVALGVDNNLFNSINSYLNQNTSQVELIIILPNIDENREVDLLYNYIKDYNNIMLLELKDDNINLGRNKSISMASGEYIIFLDSYDVLKDNQTILNLYKNASTNDLDILMFDFISINNNLLNKDNHSLEVEEKELFKSRKRFLDDSVLKGYELYNCIVKKSLDIDNLNTHIFKLDFLKKEKIFFNNESINKSYDFIIECLIKAEDAKYIDLYGVKTIMDSSVNVNINYLKYNTLKYKFYVVDKILNIYDNVSIQSIKLSILKNLGFLLNNMFKQAVDNKDQDNINKVILYLNYIKETIFDDYYTEIAIELDMLLESYNLNERTKFNLDNEYLSNQYTNVYYIDKLIEELQFKKKIDRKDIEKIFKIVKNKKFKLFNSYDKLLEYINLYEYNKQSIKYLNNILYELSNLRDDIQNGVNSKLLYYKVFEEKFDMILGCDIS